MDEDAPHQMRWPRVVARVVGYPMLAVVLYVLSVGPVQWLLAARSDALDRFVDRIYEPLLQISPQTEVRRSLDAYMTWWWILPGGGYERSQAKWLNDMAQPPRDVAP